MGNETGFELCDLYHQFTTNNNLKCQLSSSNKTLKSRAVACQFHFQWHHMSQSNLDWQLYYEFHHYANSYTKNMLKWLKNNSGRLLPLVSCYNRTYHVNNNITSVSWLVDEVRQFHLLRLVWDGGILANLYCQCIYEKPI